MDKVAIWKYLTYIHQNRMTRNVNNIESLTPTKQAGAALFISRIWKHTYHR